MDKFDGDTLIIIGPNGADYDVIGGDPARDTGYVNHVNIAMLTEPGWCGNELEPVASRKLGSKYLPLTRLPFTNQSALDLNKAAEADVKGDEFGDQRAITTIDNPGQMKTAVFLQPPTNDLQALLLTKNGKSWVNQILGESPRIPGGGGSTTYVYEEMQETNGDIILDTNGDPILAKVEQ